MDKMELWNKVCKTNPKETREVQYPFKHTSISAQFQIKHATEQWGSIGSAWGVKNETFTPVMMDIEEKGFLFYNATLYYPDGELPIHADINFFNKTKSGMKIDNDILKKVATDALTKGLSKLGFNSDVFEGLFDDNKYVQQMMKEFSLKPEKQDWDIAKSIDECKSQDELKTIWSKLTKEQQKEFTPQKDLKKIALSQESSK